MKVYDTPDLRNVILLGHGDCGKTSLTSGFLFATGVTNRFGSVDDGTATTDFDEEEVARKISLQTAMAHVEWDGRKLNIIDAPGYAAFVADAKSAIYVSDSALLLVEAVSGIQVVTDRTFKYAADFDLPVFFVLNKMDRENADFGTVVAALQERYGRGCLPVQLPIGKEHDFSGVVDLIGRKAFTFAKDASGKMTNADVPGDMADAVETARNELIEMVAENDDALMEKFLEAGELSAEEFASGLRTCIRDRKIFPIACASASQMIGMQPLMSMVATLAPAPGERGELTAYAPSDLDKMEEADTVTRATDSGAPLSMFVFKTMADAFAGKLSLFKVMSGTLKSDSNVNNMNHDCHERLGGISLMQGKQSINIGELRAGDLGVLSKLKETQTSDTLADPANPIAYPPITFREPAISYAVEPKSKGDEDKIAQALHRLMEEDPTLKTSRHPQTHEMLVSGTGQVHVEVALAKMKRKFGVDAILHPPKVPYLETITAKVSNVEGKHKKQSGGRGQFGVCVIDMEPLPRGSGFVFEDKIFGGSIPQNYRPAVRKGIEEVAERGWQADCPVVDFKIILLDGKYHNVDSSEMAFKIAGSLAFKHAMEKARPTILEPLMQVEIVAPEEYMGDIMGDLSSRRGKPQGMEAQGHDQIIKAQVPLREMLDYSSTLKSITSDRGSFHMEFDHYQEAPVAIRKEIVEDAEKAKAEKAGEHG
ncbi:MAG: elongation factor G [Acidobacteria bacterium]|uniref:Elongation factor G n=1 Tax=Candidatus Polarisedimenticola svalbardensis TaxID=2886004 RepID=A0A8J6Y493_9BACT|nr:elongation factor G [Candidatus Polarisedimenticola svalbardensis]